MGCVSIGFEGFFLGYSPDETRLSLFRITFWPDCHYKCSKNTYFHETTAADSNSIGYWQPWIILEANEYVRNRFLSHCPQFSSDTKNCSPRSILWLLRLFRYLKTGCRANNLRLFGIKWGCFATERTETFEKKLENSFSLWSLWLTPPNAREPNLIVNFGP